MVTISGQQESRQENNFSSKSFFKKFSIPHGVKPENITSSLSPSGVLTISALYTEVATSGNNGNLITSSTTTTSSSSSVTRSGGFPTRQQIVLKPKINKNEGMISSIHSSFEDVSKDLCHVIDDKTFEVSEPTTFCKKCHDFTNFCFL
jgi:hypothetical protein